MFKFPFLFVFLCVCICCQGYVSQVLSGCYGHDVIGLERQQHMALSAADTYHVVKKHEDCNSKLLNSNAKKGTWTSIEFTLENTNQCYEEFDELIHKISNDSLTENVQEHLKSLKVSSICDITNGSNCDRNDDATSSKLSIHNRTYESEHSKKCDSSVHNSNGLRDCHKETNLDCMDVQDRLGVCMMGLHCCGDLTPTMLRFFVRYARLLLIRSYNLLL